MFLSEICRMKIVIIDNYDSFTYNLAHMIEKIAKQSVSIIRNDEEAILNKVEKFDKIILSPGPGLPENNGLLIPLIKRYANSKSILGVCLGHQAIGLTFGCQLKNMKQVVHGESRNVLQLTQDKFFAGIPNQFQVGRYHSWLIHKPTISDQIEIILTDDKGEIMAIRHKTCNIYGIQFHPESVLTQYGDNLVQNWLNL